MEETTKYLEPQNLGLPGEDERVDDDFPERLENSAVAADHLLRPPPAAAVVGHRKRSLLLLHQNPTRPTKTLPPQLGTPAMSYFFAYAMRGATWRWGREIK